MSGDVEIWRCAGCGAGYFPERYLCHHCHGAAFTREAVRGGTVEEVSTIHHMIGQENWTPRRIASVRTDAGVLMTVGLADGAAEGERIELYSENGAPFGRRGASPAG